MEFWPLAVVVLASGLAALAGIVVMTRLHKPNTKGISPHHRWNRRTDLLHARETDAARRLRS